MSPFYPRRAAPLVVLAVLAVGCHALHRRPEPRVVPADVPRELDKVTLPDYRVESPDILLIEAVRAVPKPPYTIQPLDVLNVQVGAATLETLSGTLGVDADGTINLGSEYGGAVRVVGLTVPEAQQAITDHLTKVVLILNPKVAVSLAQSQAAQRIGGPHLVQPDGTIYLGTYGSVRVAGLTKAEVRKAVEAKLAESLLDPVVSVDVQNFNSKVVYVILAGAGPGGQAVYRLPVTGNETVLDAVAQINGLSVVSDVNRIWVNRPAPAGSPHQILPVDWRAVTECGDTATNYQLMPGDRLFVGANPMAAVDARLALLLAPIERVFGVTLLGTSVYRQIALGNQFGGGFGGFGF